MHFVLSYFRLYRSQKAPAEEEKEEADEEVPADIVTREVLPAVCPAAIPRPGRPNADADDRNPSVAEAAAAAYSDLHGTI